MGDKSQVRVNFLGDASALAAASRKAQQALAGVDRQADKASRSLDGAGAAGERSGSKIGSAMRGFGKMFAGFSVAAGGAAIAGGLLGVKTAAGMEQARISFETMLGSAKKADVFLKDLSAFAAKTPFEFPELQTAASSLISAGIEASKVIPIMTTLGDVTSGMGTGSEGVKRATVALQQMSAAGRITGEDLNQLRDAGIPVYDLLAKATGKSKAEVVKLAQAGKLGSRELGLMMKALETGAGLERFSGLMDKQSQSLTGLWSTFKDTLGMGMARLLGPAIPALKSGLGQVSAAVGGFIDGVMGSVRVMAGGRPAMETFGLGLRALVLAFQDGDVTSDGFVGKMERVGVAMRGVVDAGRDFVGMLGDAGRAVSPYLQGALLAVGRALGNTIRWFNEHRGAAKALAVTIGVLVLATKVHAAVLTVTAAGGMVSWLRQTRLITAATKTWAAAQWVANGALVGGGVMARAIASAASLAHTLWIVASTYVRLGVVAAASGVRQVAAMAATRVAAVAVAAATKAWAAAQWLLNLAMTANPIGLVVVAVAALVAGMVIAYQRSETFRTIVQGAFKAISDAASFMWNSVLKPVFRLWLDTWFTIVGALVNGAASAFGWVPGIGDKLKAAAKKFNEFRDDVNRSLDGVKDKTVKLTVVAGREVDVNSLAGMQRFAAGGNPRRGLGLVGEEGPEVVDFSGSEHVYTAAQSRSMLGGRGGLGGGRGGGIIGTLVIRHEDPNGRVVHTQLLKLKRELGGNLGLA